MKNYLYINLVVVSLVFLLIITVTQTLFAQQDSGTLEVEIKYTNGDRVDYSETIFVVYQGNDSIPYLEKLATNNPDFIKSLPIGYKYKIEIYVNNMYASVGYVDLQEIEQKLDLTVPLSGGLKLRVFYEDGQTPIKGAAVIIKSHDGKEWRKSITNENGDTLRAWIQSTNRAEDYYAAEIWLGEILLYTYSPIKLQAGLPREYKVIVPVPDIVDQIRVHVYKNPSDKVRASDGEFSVVLLDSLQNEVAESKLTPRGDAFFSSLKVGEYVLSVIKKADDGTEQEWVSKNILILGNKTSFNIFKIDSEDIVEDSQDSVVAKSCDCVAFRFDDVQNYWLNDIQIQVIDVFLQKNIPLTVGIIGIDFGDDPKISEFIQENSDKLEIANHGFQHEDFTIFTKDQQIDLMRQTNEILSNVIGVSPKVFIPPLNNFDENTISAMKENEMTHLSSSIVRGDSPPFPLENAELYRFPETATTGDFDNDLDRIVGLENSVTFDHIQDSLDNYGFAVVSMHPQEFSVFRGGIYANEINSNQIEELELLIDRIHAEGLRVVPLGQINLDSNIIIPSWIKNNAGWWAKGQINDSDFILGIQFLVSQGVIMVQETEVDSKPSDEIPNWIKNNASWWADGQISDVEFVKGIEFLIKQGIITY